jgi:F0F1-type ATP synthase assembly protein I
MDEKKDNNKAPWWQPSLMLFSRLSGWIAGPVILAVFLGRWLDRRYGTEPWLFLLTVGAAFILSSVGIVRDSVKEMKRIEEEGKSKKEKR